MSKVYVGTIHRYLSHTDDSVAQPKANSNSYNWFSYAWKMRCLEKGEKFDGKAVRGLWNDLSNEKKEIFKKAALKTREPKKKAHGKNVVGAYQKFERFLADNEISCPVSGMNFNSFASLVWQQIAADHPKVHTDWLKKDLATQKKYAREAIRKIDWSIVESGTGKKASGGSKKTRSKVVKKVVKKKAASTKAAAKKAGGGKKPNDDQDDAKQLFGSAASESGSYSYYSDYSDYSDYGSYDDSERSEIDDGPDSFG